MELGLSCNPIYAFPPEIKLSSKSFFLSLLLKYSVYFSSILGAILAAFLISLIFIGRLIRANTFGSDVIVATSSPRVISSGESPPLLLVVELVDVVLPPGRPEVVLEVLVEEVDEVEVEVEDVEEVVLVIPEVLFTQTAFTQLNDGGQVDCCRHAPFTQAPSRQFTGFAKLEQSLF